MLWYQRALGACRRTDASAWKLNIGGEGANRDVQIGFDALKKMPAFDVVAVCQCVGNQCGLVQLHVAGVQCGHGAMGCAQWRGARLKDVLDRLGSMRRLSK
jgi:DMSO/TMAO reductase YedYZ molybdopterin-dependent catalytic subunit